MSEDTGLIGDFGLISDSGGGDCANTSTPLHTCSKRTLGRMSEDKAVEYLQSRGHKIVDRNWRVRYGEIDIVAIKDGEVVVVEVRSQRNSGGTEEAFAAVYASESVTLRKVQRLRKLGYMWCSTNRWSREALAILLLVVTWYNSRRFKIDEVPVY